MSAEHRLTDMDTFCLIGFPRRAAFHAFSAVNTRNKFFKHKGWEYIVVNSFVKVGIILTPKKRIEKTLIANLLRVMLVPDEHRVG